MDERDGSPELFRCLDGPSPEAADARLDIRGTSPPGLAFWVAALRETFEETGILLVSGGAGCRSALMDDSDPVGRLRRQLNRGRTDFRTVLDTLGTRLAGTTISYIGHWVTPVRERHRYDTRFFGGEVPAGCPCSPDGAEMVQALWIPPSEALALNREGALPMVPPTLRTLQALGAFGTPSEALRALGGRKIPRLLPRVEETENGVRFTPEIVPPE